LEEQAMNTERNMIDRAATLELLVDKERVRLDWLIGKIRYGGLHDLRSALPLDDDERPILDRPSIDIAMAQEAKP
jgi:hypothetical protein